MPPGEDKEAPISGLVRALSVPARRDPSHRSEMITQWICGEHVRGLERREGWIRGAGEDDYAAWVPESAVIRSEEAGSWVATARSLGTEIIGSGGRPGYLPWGARVRRIEGARLELPDGTSVRASDPVRIVGVSELLLRFPPDADRLVDTADGWVGVPYVWGGRTNTGCDCSGFVQAVLAVHGVALPRDSDQQAEAGPTISGFLPSTPDLEPADLVFFAPEGKGITHVAISTGGTGIVHCSATRGVVQRDDLAAGGKLETLLRENVVTATRPLTSISRG
jgi:hypothetical protein